MANPNRTGYLARQPRVLVMVEEISFRSRSEADNKAEEMREAGLKNVRVSRLTMGPKRKPIYTYFVRRYERTEEA